MKKFPIPALFVLSVATVAFAQEDRAVVTGTVTDPSQAAIANAVVTIDNKATGFHREVKTNETGAFLIPGLSIGVYDITIHKDGFRIEQYSGLEPAVGQTRTIDAHMQIASRAQEVDVVANVEMLDQTTSKVAGVIESTQVSELPINGRAWTALMALVPGAMDSGGGTQKTIRFAGAARTTTMDATGILNQAPNTNTRLQISTEAIAEFKVDTMLYGADTGGTNGGRVEVISKIGVERLSRERLRVSPQSFGGAIVKDRTFFFVAYEGLRQRLGSTLIGNVPSDAFRAQVLAQSPVLAPIVNAYPHGNRALSSTTSQYVAVGDVAANEDSAMIRIDHRFSDYKRNRLPVPTTCSTHAGHSMAPRCLLCD
jgi:hypothetical protein